MTEKRLMPVSQIGRWSVWLAGLAVVLFLLGLLETFRPYAGVAGLLLGLIALVLSLVALIKHKERNVFVYFACLIGVLDLALLIAELFFIE